MGAFGQVFALSFQEHQKILNPQFLSTELLAQFPAENIKKRGKICYTLCNNHHPKECHIFASYFSCLLRNFHNLFLYTKIPIFVQVLISLRISVLIYNFQFLISNIYHSFFFHHQLKERSINFTSFNYIKQSNLSISFICL